MQERQDSYNAGDNEVQSNDVIQKLGKQEDQYPKDQ